MSAKKSSKPATADLRAFRERRQAELADPTSEAKRHEQLFLSSVGTAQGEIRWLVENRAWLALGFESPVDWWETRIRPTFVELDMRPAPEVARQILAAVEEYERALPAPQRRNKKQLTELALASDWTGRGRVEDRSKRRPATGDDLDETSAGTVAPTETEHGAGTPEDSAGSGDDYNFAGSTGDGGVSADVAALQTSGDQKDAPVEGPPASGNVAGDEAAEDPSVEPPLEGSSAADPETPAAPTVATQPDDPDAGSNTSGEDETAFESSPDGQNPFTEWVWDLLDVIGRKPDPDDGADANADLFDALVNAAADLEDFLSDVRVVRTTDPMPTPGGAA